MSKFDLSITHCFTGDMGQFIPVSIKEVLPGDKMVGNVKAVIRMMPQLAPFFTRCKASIFTFFVPNRLVWDEWEEFITGGPTNDPADAPEWPHIQLASAEPAVGSLLDHMGIPVNAGSADPDVKVISALPLRAIQLCFNEWGRDQDLVTELTISKASGLDTTTDRTLQNLAWYKDYLTAARPTAQKGPAITLPLGTSAPVVPDGTDPSLSDAATDTYGGTAQITTLGGVVQKAAFDDLFGSGGGSADHPARWHNTGMRTDLSAATSVEINAVRRALAYQRFSENRERYGSRYTEYLRALGVISPDERLQRPELLARGEQVLQTSEVLQTAQTDADPDGVGQLFGHTIGMARSNSFKRYFPEHGFLITFMCIRPDAIYNEAVDKMYFREFKEDYYQQELAHIGSQAVLNREVNFMGTNADDSGVFGYVDPYDDLRFSQSYVSGKFRPTENLKQWTLARSSTGPYPIPLNDEFVTCVPSKRVFPVSTEPVLWVKARVKLIAKRIIPSVGTSITI